MESAIVDLTPSLLLGADGGGTSCRVALLSQGQRFEAVPGPANLASDRAGAIACVRDGIVQVAHQAGISDAALDACGAHVGLAGIMSESEAQAIAAEIGLRRITVTDDQVTAVAGALGIGVGTVAGIGTGSFLARQHAGQVRYVGGWGFDPGDEAAGAWLGRSALSAVLQAADGMRAPSGLTQESQRRFDGLPGVVEFAAGADPGAFAALAPDIIAAAETGDAVARGLMLSGARYIEDALAAMGWVPGETLCLIGGVGPAYARYLGADLVQSLRSPLGSAVDGALQLAGAAQGRATS